VTTLSCVPSNEVGLQAAPELGTFLTLLTRLARSRTATT
jgi:hypothetical protein